MRGPIHGPDIPGEVAQRARKDVQIMRQRGGHEGKGDMHPGGFKFVDAARGQL